jgi:hypothetical protein
VLVSRGVEDHLHILTSLHPAVCLADLVKDIKTIKKRVRVLKMPVVKLFGRPHSTTELLDLWSECDQFDDWKAVINELRKRLAA